MELSIILGILERPIFEWIVFVHFQKKSNCLVENTFSTFIILMFLAHTNLTYVDLAQFWNLNICICILTLRPLMVDFLMPESDKDRGENPIVDSLAVASDWTIVSKCALHGLIYVFDLKVNAKTYHDEFRKFVLESSYECTPCQNARDYTHYLLWLIGYYIISQNNSYMGSFYWKDIHLP